MAPRITISKNGDGELEIWLNEAGRDLLIQRLNGLNQANDHFHLSPSGTGVGIPTRLTPYREGDEIIEWGKVLLRLDEWDREYFPHVLDETTEP